MMSCSKGFGHKVMGGDFSVYFEDSRHEKLAEELAFFWKENGLMTGDNQDLQISSENDIFILKLISNDSNSEVSFKERKTLLKLQEILQEEIFKSQLELEICNGKFETIYKIN